MTARNHDDRVLLSDAAVADLIAALRQLADALELHRVARIEVERLAFDDSQLDIWQDGNPF